MRGMSESPKLVVAHFMVGNTYPYTIREWRKDIELAIEYGFDGFALNVGVEDWQVHRVGDAFGAALRSERGFKLFISFDMTSIPSHSKSDISHLLRYLTQFAAHPNYLRYVGEVLVSTFAGENGFFGFGIEGLNEGWTWAKQEAERAIGLPIHFIPTFFVDPARYPSLTCIDGYFHWNGGWPTHLTPLSPRDDVSHPKLDSDMDHLRHLGDKTYMAAVSPWFFTHYGKDSWNKNWIYRGDDHLLVRRWEYLMRIRNWVDIVQVISWNDYGESHYLAPPLGAQPNSERWVNSCPHDAWLSLNAYYTNAFKSGGYLQEPDGDRADAFASWDKIWMWARPHLRSAVATDDHVARPDRWELTDDLFWVVVLVSRPCRLILSSGPFESDPHSRVYHLVTSGIHKFSHPMFAGASMRAELVRDGVTVSVCDPGVTQGFRFENKPKVYNFNAFVCSTQESN